MRTLLLATIAALGCCGALSAEEPAGIYDRDPQHLWNRLYRAIATRTVDGTEFGSDNSEPYMAPVEDVARLNAVLDEFLAGNSRSRSPGDLQQALLLNDVWAAFDLVAARDAKPLQIKLARAIWRLRMPAAAIAALPDNYAQAVKTGDFAKDFDAAHPNAPFLPPDLFDANGPWVQIGKQGARRDRAIPRRQLLGSLDIPGLHSLPRRPQSDACVPADAQSVSHAMGARTGCDCYRYVHPGAGTLGSVRLNKDTPQFPAGTVVALVRQMVVIDEKLEPVLTPITQAVQLRVYWTVGDTRAENWQDNFGARQSVHDS